jgi:hypothetical protein
MCFGLGAIEHLLIWVVVVLGVLAVIRVLLALATPPAEYAQLLAAALQIVKIVLWAAITVVIIVVIFALLACVVTFR